MSANQLNDFLDLGLSK